MREHLYLFYIEYRYQIIQDNYNLGRNQSYERKGKYLSRILNILSKEMQSRCIRKRNNKQSSKQMPASTLTKKLESRAIFNCFTCTEVWAMRNGLATCHLPITIKNKIWLLCVFFPNQIFVNSQQNSVQSAKNMCYVKKIKIMLWRSIFWKIY